MSSPFDLFSGVPKELIPFLLGASEKASKKLDNALRILKENKKGPLDALQRALENGDYLPGLGGLGLGLGAYSSQRPKSRD